MTTFTDTPPIDIPEEPYPPTPGGPEPPEWRASDAFHEARQCADDWARLAGKRTFVVRNDGRYFLADAQVLRDYHRADIVSKRAHVVYAARSLAETQAAE